MWNTDLGTGNQLSGARGTAAFCDIRTLLKKLCKNPLGKPSQGIFSKNTCPGDNHGDDVIFATIMDSEYQFNRLL